MTLLLGRRGTRVEEADRFFCFAGLSIEMVAPFLSERRTGK
jgi:hypothetical protein